MNEVDLTTEDSAQSSLEQIGFNPLEALGLVVLGFPSVAIAVNAAKLVAHIINRGQVDDGETAMVERIIAKGAESDVDTMKIKIRKEQALGIDVKGLSERTKAKVVVGASGETEVELDITYK